MNLSPVSWLFFLPQFFRILHDHCRNQFCIRLEPVQCETYSYNRPLFKFIVKNAQCNVIHTDIGGTKIPLHKLVPNENKVTGLDIPLNIPETTAKLLIGVEVYQV